MKIGRLTVFFLIVIFGRALTSIWLPQDMHRSIIPLAEAAGGTVTGPNVVAPDRYVYYPGTETLAKDEVRVTACGTGMPDQRRGQASACFLFEFGNGDDGTRAGLGSRFLFLAGDGQQLIEPLFSLLAGTASA